MATKKCKNKISLKAKFEDCLRNIRRKWRLLLFSAAHALLLLLACNFLWNKPYTFSSESDFIKVFTVLKQATGNMNTVPDSVLLVNVAYDRDLVDYYDEYGIPAGKIDITDRQKLLELFDYLEKDSSYRFIVCDVFFDASLKTAQDSALFNVMSRIPRLVVPMHEDGKTLPAQLAQKAAYADYKVNIVEGNLLKYQYLQHGKKSIPLFMWEERTGETLKKHCFWYSMNGKLVTNSIILDFQTKFQDTYNRNGEKNYLNLGSDLLELLREINPKNYFKNKIILIGDLTENDIHDTTAGAMPGALINYNAYQMLEQHKLDISVWFCFWLFALFFTVTYLTVSKINIIDKLPQKGILKNDVVKLLLSFFSYTFILVIFNLFIYVFWKHFIEIFISVFYFTVLFKTGVDLFFIIKRNKNEKKNHCNDGGNCVLPESVGAGHAEDNVS
jgi:hypothetical protein